MKRIIVLMITLATIPSVFLVPAFAEDISTEETKIEDIQDTQEIEPRASLYFSGYAYDLEPASKKGYLTFSSLVARTNRADKIRVSVQIQQYNDGWEDYGEEHIGISSKASYSFEDDVKVERGKEYRALFYYEAFVDDEVVETKIGSTSSVLAP